MDLRLRLGRLFSQRGWVHRDFPPPQEIQLILLHRFFRDLQRAHQTGGIAGEEEHAHGQIGRVMDVLTKPLHLSLKQLERNLRQNARPVASARIGGHRTAVG